MTSDEISLEDYEKRFFQFITNFKSGNIYKYRERVKSLPDQHEKILYIDFDDLVFYDGDLALALSENPKNLIKALKYAVYETLKIERPLEAEEFTPDDIYIALRGENIGHAIKLREISSKYIGKLISIQGLLVKLSQLYTKPVKAVFKCSYCGYVTEVSRSNPGESIKKPTWCERENKRREFVLVKEETKFIDIQFARIQERPDELPPGQIPRFIDIYIESPMTEKAYPGEYVRIVGILDIKLSPSKERGYEFILITNNIESLGKEDIKVTLTRKDEELLKKYSKDPGFYTKVLRSFAPSIYGYEEVKEALLLAIIGADDRILPDGTRIRGKIHVLLVGDPGVAKSQLLKYAAMIAPKGLYTSGRGSTAAGLTAAVLRDPGGGMSLEAGAVVLADMGVCAIDEIDKMRSEDRVALHEAMEQLTVSISKGGIIATLNARTTILAAANPKHGRYNPDLWFNDNVNLPSTLISRFDIIHVMRDVPDIERDEKLIRHMVDARIKEAVYEDIFDVAFLRKYIIYARKLKVTFEEEAINRLMEFYKQMRAKYSSERENIPITPRQFEAFLRIAEASAKAHLRRIVTLEDAEVAIRQITKFLYEVARDIETGEIDVTIISTGVPGRKASRVETVKRIIEKIQREKKGEAVPKDEIIERVIRDTNLKDPDVIEEIIDRLEREGVIYQPAPYKYSLVGFKREERKW
ncbi:MAG TPA: minichromosome maintenance protein MCM [Thermoprotei archaeon]|nr:minichromosome maintenance protein MCM [Thermoprotei archaeon]